MSKMKTRRSTSRRFTTRSDGTIKRSQAFERYVLIKEATKNKRHLHGTEGVYETNLKSVRTIMPYV